MAHSAAYTISMEFLQNTKSPSGIIRVLDVEEHRANMFHQLKCAPNLGVKSSNVVDCTPATLMLYLSLANVPMC